MKKFLLYFLLLTGPMLAHAQFDRLKDSVVNVYGFVMTADSLVGIPGVTVSVVGRNQGIFTNDQGVFSIALLKGDKIIFSSIGYKPIEVQIPRDLKGNQYSMIQTMVTDAVYLPATIIKPRPTREQFERDFVNTKAAKRRILLRGLPSEAREASNYYLKQSATRYSYLGQAPPQNIFNPLAWADFIKAWKRGDFKSSNN